MGAAWRERWLERLAQTPAFIEPWLAHQLRDDYWRHGSVREDYAAIEVPVYAVGGWSDGYTDAIPRLLAGLPGPRKGLIGPWSHAFPNDAVPGPEIGFLEESLRWWDHWLKGIDTGIMDEPVLRAWMQEYTPPAPHHREWPGRWVAEPCWPPADAGDRARRLYLRAERERRTGREPRRRGTPHPPGRADGRARRRGADRRRRFRRLARRPARRRRALAQLHLASRSPRPSRSSATARVRLTVTSDRPGAGLVARLCDVAPTGESLLVTRDLFNLTHRAGHDRALPLVPGEPAVAEFPLKVIAHRFGTGHRIRLSVSTTYWPWMWPHPEPVTLGLSCGPDSFLDLPVRQPLAQDAALAPFGPPEHPAGIATEVLARRPTQRTIRHDLTDGSAEVIFDWDVGGNFRLADAGIEADGSNLTSYRIVTGQPLSAEVRTEQSASLRSALPRRGRPGDRAHDGGPGDVPGDARPGRPRGRPPGALPPVAPGVSTERHLTCAA